jgi:hypothetical protein
MHDADVLRACAAIVHDHDELPGNRTYRSYAWINACESLAKLIERAAEDGPVAATAGLFTRDETTAALDRAMDVLRDELGLGERDTDLLTLFCRVAAGALGGEPVTLDEVTGAHYEEPAQVRGWWDGWS